MSTMRLVSQSTREQIATMPRAELEAALHLAWCELDAARCGGADVSRQFNEMRGDLAELCRKWHLVDRRAS